MAYRVVGGSPKINVTRGFGADIASGNVTKRNLDESEGGDDTGSSFTSNKLRGGIFKSNFNNLYPDKVYVDNYKSFLNKSYIESVKLELGGRARKGLGSRFYGVGVASGNLRKNMNALTLASVKQYSNKGEMEIRYSVEPKFGRSPWGESLAYDRPALNVSVKNIMGWMSAKIAKGTFVLRSSNSRKSKSSAKDSLKNKDKGFKQKLMGVAIAISKSMEKSPKPPVLKDWYVIDRNKRLEMRFNLLTKKKGSYYRTQIRKSIIRNINRNK